MEDPDLTEQNNSDATALAFAHLCTKLSEERFNVAPLDVGARRMGEQRCKRALVLLLHRRDGTKERYLAAQVVRLLRS